jgi:hypothetical protein
MAVVYAERGLKCWCKPCCNLHAHSCSDLTNAKYGGRDILTRLVQAGADLFATNQQLESALHVASRQHQVDASAFIISTFQAKSLRPGQIVHSRMAGRQDGIPAIQWRNFLGQNALMVALDWDDTFVFPRTVEYITARRQRLHTVASMLLDAGIGTHHADYTGEQSVTAFLVVYSINHF